MSGLHGRNIPQVVERVKSTSGCLSGQGRWAINIDMAEYFGIGERLAQIRQAFSEDGQKAWAERHGFSVTQYNNWERGVRRLPVESAEKLCDLYGLTLDFIYRGRRDGLSDTSRNRL